MRKQGIRIHHVFASPALPVTMYTDSWLFLNLTPIDLADELEGLILERQNGTLIANTLILY